jgi:hypothetical protein
MKEEEEIIFNRFVQVFNEWICIHDEDIHFPECDPSKPRIKLCGQTLRIRANDAWTKLPDHLREAMVAHELGHREMGHASIPQDNPFYRMGFVILHNTVDPRELEADRYACKLVSKNKYIAALKELILLEKQYHNPNNTAIKEFEYRIKELEHDKVN